MIVVWPDGSVATVSAVGISPEYYRFTVDLGLAPARLGHMVGLLGDADGNESRRPRHPCGRPGHLPQHPVRRAVRHVRQQLADQQRRVALRLRPRRDHRDVHRPDLSRRARDAASLPPAARASATATCNLFGLTTQELLDACIVDVGLTGDADFANNAADAQEAALGIPTNAGATQVGTETTVVTTVAGENAVRTFPASRGRS